MKKIKVMVLMGGKSPEHEISVIGGKNVVSALDDKRYDVLPVVISKDGKKWQLTDKESLLSLVNPISLKGTSKDIVLQKKKEIEKIYSIDNKIADIVFIVMHGPYGEDGTIQGMMELIGVPYTGSGVTASAIGMDKEMFRIVMKTMDILIPKYISLRKGENILSKIKLLGDYPYFIKPNDQGSSVGSRIARNKKELLTAISDAFSFSDRVLVDEYIKGVELTCGVLGNDIPKSLPLVEIVPKGEFFDYDSKYTESGAEEIVPARISPKTTKKIQETAIKVYKSLGCKGFGRVDFILKGNKVYVLEINTIPGMTAMSLLPKEAKAAGISYSKLLSKIINYALETRN